MITSRRELPASLTGQITLAGTWLVQMNALGYRCSQTNEKDLEVNCWNPTFVSNFFPLQYSMATENSSFRKFLVQPLLGIQLFRGLPRVKATAAFPPWMFNQLSR